MASFILYGICIVVYFLCITGKKNELSPIDVQKAISDLWKVDTNRADENQVQIDIQSHTNSRDRVDNAPRKLFRRVDQSLLQKPTYKALIDLFDAYNTSTSSPSNSQIDNFLDALSTTGPYGTLQQILADHDYAPAKNDVTFRKALKDLWFGDYSRSKEPKSSGFEHVFIGEVKNGEIGGLHNWVRLYWLESHNQLEYTGYIIKRQPRVPILQYKIGDAWKPSGSVMIGTSPEFDFSVFTLCFLTRPGEDACQFFLGDCSSVEVTSFPFNQNGNVYIGTTYPSPWKTEAKCPLQ